MRAVRDPRNLFFWPKIVAFLALCILLGFCAERAKAHGDRYLAVIERWYDGDTPTVTIDLGLGYQLTGQALRLLCVDTPELRGAEKERGEAVRDVVRDWAPEGATVILSLHGRGKYGRPLAVMVPEGWRMSINRRLLREGLATLEAYTEADRRDCAEIE